MMTQKLAAQALVMTLVLLATPALAEESVRGVVRARHQAALATDLVARVASIAVREGDTFRAGDVLVEFDCRRLDAELEGLTALRREMQVTVEKYRLLLKTQSAGRLEAQVAEARLDKAAADVKALKSQQDHCTIVAPFDGRAITVGIQQHEMTQAGRPFLAIAATGFLEVDMIVPSAWVRWLKPGIEFKFAVDELGKPLPAKVERIGAAVDAVSQTIKIVASFSGDTANVLPGMSGTGSFPDAMGQ